MRINIQIDIIDGNPDEVNDFIEKLNTLCGTDKVSVSNFAETPVAEQKPKKKTIDEIWRDMLLDLPYGFEKSGIGRYTCNSKLDRNIEMKLSQNTIDLSIPDPDNKYSTIILRKYSNRITTPGFNPSFIPELLDRTIEDQEIKRFIEKYYYYIISEEEV